MADSPPKRTASLANLRPAAELASASSHFQSLPRELRNFIYHELWKSTPKVRGMCNTIDSRMVFRSTAKEPYLNLGRGDITACRFPSWLRTCKSIRHEGLEELVRFSLGTVGPWQLSSRGFLYWSLNLLHPTADKRLIIWTENVQLNPRFKGRATFTLGECDTTCTSVLDILPTVRSLRLKIKMRPCCRFCFEGHEQRGWRLDLSSLEQVALRLEVFELEVRFVLEKFAMDWSNCRSSFTPEIERVGRLWVGGKGALSIKVTPRPDQQYETVLYAFRTTRERTRSHC